MFRAATDEAQGLGIASILGNHVCDRMELDTVRIISDCCMMVWYCIGVSACWSTSMLAYSNVSGPGFGPLLINFIDSSILGKDLPHRDTCIGSVTVGQTSIGHL